MKTAVGDVLMMFSARTGAQWFWSIRPSAAALGASAVAVMVSTVLAAFWPPGTTNGVPTVGLARGHGNTNLLPIWTVLYCVGCALIQDTVKVGVFRVIQLYIRLRHSGYAALN